MSTYFYIYAEAKVGDRWLSLNPVMQALNGEYQSSELYYFTYSSYSEVYYRLADLQKSRGLPEDCSPGVRKHFENLDELTDTWGQKETWREYYCREVIVVNYYEAIKEKVRKDRPHKYMYYVLREHMAQFQCGELEEINYWLTEEEYKQLSEKDRKEYVYFEWDNAYDEYRVYREIETRVDTQLAFLADMPHMVEGSYGYAHVEPNQVRLIIYRC